MKIYFDVDDTIYDQCIPFAYAFNKVFVHYRHLPMQSIFYWFRFYSDQVFEDSQNGLITMDDMHVYRITAALQEFSILITTSEALTFQQEYKKAQKLIVLTDTMKEILNLLATKNIEVGIITNGPTNHQKSKIDTLQLTKWIPKENIYISQQVGISKPDKKIFQLIGEDSSYVYIGDSYYNDIIGAKSANWKCIWMNRRNQSIKDVKPDYEVKDENQLMILLRILTG